ncbi:DNA translocase FtsK [Streptosporangium sandarakinum]
MTASLLDEIGEDHRLFLDAARAAVSSRSASAPMIQRKVRVGFVKALRLLILLEDAGIVGPHSSTSGRTVLVQADALSEHLTRLGIAAPSASSAPGEPPAAP